MNTPMTASEMGKKSQAIRKQKMSKEEISAYYKWVVSHRPNVRNKKNPHTSIDKHHTFDTMEA